MKPPRNLYLIATHLNAPYGRIVTPEDVYTVLSQGTLKGLAARPEAQALLSRLLIECDTNTIGWACIRCGGITAANNLYQELVSAGEPRSLSWENALREHI